MTSWEIPDIEVVDNKGFDLFNVSLPLEDLTPWKDYD